MIHEFAVEPEVMADWNHFRVLWEDFGVSQGRFLVEYPGSWRQKVHELVDKLSLSAPVKAHAIRSKISDPCQQRCRLVKAQGRSYDPQKSWVENAAYNHGSAPAFRAVVARCGLSDRTDVIAADDLDRSAAPWKVERQDKNCPRRADEMLRRVAMLLRHSRELVLVDPYFDACEHRFRRPFEAFVRVRKDWKRLELHTARHEPFRRDLQEHNFRRNLAPAVPRGCTLRVCFWQGQPKGKRMHPRLVLTERGGVQFDHGLDEGRSSSETTLVSLLEHKSFLGFWEDYRPDSRVFGEPEVLEIVGCG